MFTKFSIRLDAFPGACMSLVGVKKDIWVMTVFDQINFFVIKKSKSLDPDQGSAKCLDSDLVNANP